MYSTRLINNRYVDGNRYITVGDPYKDFQANMFRQPKKGEKPPMPFRTKIFPPNAENGYFTKVEYKGGGFQESIRYIQAQPLDSRKRGFGTKDAHRRDEFSNGVRTEQYRESIRKEKLVMDAEAEKNKDTLTALMNSRELKNTAPESDMDGTFNYSSQVPQFDIGRSRVTEFDPKSSKDTYYKFSNEREKRYGSFRPISLDIGDGAWETEYKPPNHGGKSEVKNFNDKSHLSVKTF